MSSVSSFPNEIMQKILKDLFHYNTPYQPHYRDLFNCILVNRQWCSLAIPILWTDPLRYMDVHSKPCDPIIITYLSTLNQVEKSKLNNLLGSITLFDDTIYNYPSFLKILNLNVFYLAISNFINSLDLKKRKEIFLRDHLFREIFNILTNQNANLKGLLITVDYPLCDLLPTLNDTKFGSLINPIKKMNHLSNQKGTIDNVISLLLNQYRLNGLKIGGFSKGIHRIISSLSNLKSTLSIIHFSHIDFSSCGSMNGLADCENLENLGFYCCENLTKVMWAPLLRTSMNTLEEVILYDTSADCIKEWSKRRQIKVLEELI
ncbi:1024_t:CDS:2 [Diversispora eburnea]|uniref:1024_t:CDS:1 n=1 Tax=Diversispora eburnea TaxID=1213867 RepID=A0A9N8YLB9_9GLOM|nr:1024_t:CDS:2 [Diversispora eburnea]